MHSPFTHLGFTHHREPTESSKKNSKIKQFTFNLSEMALSYSTLGFQISSAFVTVPFLVLFILEQFPVAECHARLMEPPGRSSLWRLDEFNSSHPPVNYDDNQLFCGGFAIHYDVNHGKCGLCGDSYSDPRPRPNESGGMFDIGIVARNYSVGQNISTASVLDVNHKGFFSFSICARNNASTLEEEDCFSQNTLGLSDGSGYRFEIKPEYFKSIGEPNYINTALQLPPGLVCTHCVFRWQYTTGNSWGNCSAETESLHLHEKQLGCGPQEIFRSCSDISIQ